MGERVRRKEQWFGCVGSEQSTPEGNSRDKMFFLGPLVVGRPFDLGNARLCEP